MRRNKKSTATLTLLAIALTFFYFSKTNAAKPSDFGLKEGDVISAVGSGDPDVYIVNDFGYKRLFVNPGIFNLYGHLGWDKIKKVSPDVRDAFITSGLFRNCESGDEKVYGLDVVNEDVANLRWVNSTGSQAVADDSDFFKKVFCINNKETKLYGTGSQYSSVRDIPKYARSGSNTQTPTLTSATLHIDLVAPDRILAGTPYTIIIKGSGFNKNAKVDFGAGNIQIGYAITSDSLISVLVPSGLPSLIYNLSITNPDGQIAILKDALTVQGAPPATNTGLSDTEIFSKVAPSTALIFTGNRTGAGTGIIISNDGYILTNQHVVKNYSSVEVILNDDGYFYKPIKQYVGTVLGKDYSNDLAIIKIQATGLQPIDFGSSSSSILPVGSPVYALGFPLIFDTDASSVKFLSGKIVGTSGEFLQTDANIQPGNSGGPMVNNKGQLVGINNWCEKTLGLCQQGYGFAIAIDFANPFIPGLKAGVSSTPTPTPLPSSTPTPTPVPTPTPTPVVPGTMTTAVSPATSADHAVYWGQGGTSIGTWRLTAANEGFNIERLQFQEDDSSQRVHVTKNVKTVYLKYKNKAGSTLTASSTFNSVALVAFGFTGDNRPYVSKDGNLDIEMLADFKTKAEGATSAGKFNISFLGESGIGDNTFRAVGEGSGTVLNGNSDGITNQASTTDIIVYRVFPDFAFIPPSSTKLSTVDPILRFTITAKGLSNSTLSFNENTPIKFNIVASGTGTSDTNLTIRDVSDNSIIDTDTISNATTPGSGAQLTLNFSNKNVEMAGGMSKTFSIYLDSIVNFNTPINTSVGIGSDYFQLILKDNVDGLISWTSDNANVSSLSGFLKSLPLAGYQFTAQ